MSRVDARRAPADTATIFAALGDPTRLALLGRLSGGETCSIASLSADTDLSRQAITKHLRVLERAGFVSAIRVGRESRYSFRAEPVRAAQSYLDSVSAQWEDALGRLKTFIEAPRH